MTTYEYWSLVIRGLTLFVILIGAYLTIRQLRLNTKVFQDDHDWKRRDASTKIIQQINECPHNVRLNDIFQLSTNYTPIKLKRIESKIAEDFTVQNSIHKVLNDYEGIAVGINQGLYDEEVIKNLREYAMTRVCTNFEEYIDKRRKTHVIDAWNDYENLINKWRELKMKPQIRKQTGKV